MATICGPLQPGEPRTKWSVLDWSVLVLVAAPFVVGIVAAWTGSRSGLRFIADNALNELRIRDVGSHTPLIGPYSRDGWNHPGPAFYYLFAMPYRLLGSRSNGIVVTALILNGTSAVGMVTIGRRLAGRTMMLVTAAALGVLFLSLGPMFLRDPWNPYLTVLPFGLLLYSSWALACGRIWHLPIAAALATFCMQTHIGYVPLALAVTGWGALYGLLTLHRQGKLRRDRIAPTLTLPALITTLILGLLWLGPLIDQATSTGNLGRAVNQATQGATKGPVIAAKVVGDEFTVTPDWLFGSEAPVFISGEPRSAGRTPWPFLAPVILGAIAFGWRRARPELRTFAVGICVTVIAAFAAVMRTTGFLYDYRLRFLALIGALAAATAIAFTCAARPVIRRLASVVLLAIIAVTSISAVSAATTPHFPDEESVRAMAAISRQVLARIPPGPRVLVLRRTSFGSALYLSALALALEKSGFAIRVEPDREYPSAFGSHRMFRGEPVRGVLTIAVNEDIERFAARFREREIAYTSPGSRSRRQQDLAELRGLYLVGKTRGLSSADQRRVAQLRARTRAIAVFASESAPASDPAP